MVVFGRQSTMVLACRLGKLEERAWECLQKKTTTRRLNRVPTLQPFRSPQVVFYL